MNQGQRQMSGYVLYTAIALAFSPHAAAHQPGSAKSCTDERIWAAVERAQPEQIKLLGDLVAIDTGTGEVEGTARAYALLEPFLAALDAHIERVPAEVAGLPDNLVVTFAGRGVGRRLIIAHIDTVFETGTAASWPFEISNTMASGPGVSDSKGGLVTALFALKSIRDLGITAFEKITLLIDSSEEKGSIGSRALIERLSRSHDLVLNMEPGIAPDGIVTWRKGSGNIRLTVSGRAAHAGVAPQDGRNAAIELLNQLSPIPSLPSSGDGMTVNLTMVDAGTRTNIIPDEAEAVLNVRVREQAQLDTLLKDMGRRAAAPRVVDTTVTVRYDGSFPPQPEAARNAPAIARAKAIYAEIGRELTTGGSGGGSESALSQAAGTVVIDGLGPVGTGFHSREERVDLSTFSPRLYLLTRLLMAGE